MTLLVQVLAPLGVLLIVGLFFLWYEKLWRATTREPWTYIVRRNGLLSIPIAITAVAALGVMVWQSPWWLSWLPVFLVFVAAFWAHIDWGGLRAGDVHRPTAWRCEHELRQHSANEADWLKQRLEAEGHCYARTNRKDIREGVAVGNTTPC
ncbi:MAG: hypothetical protein V3S98_03625 [Dehalococcoidia bacterium]